MRLRLLIPLALAIALPAPVALADSRTAAAARVGGFDATGVGTVITSGNLTNFGRGTGSIVVIDRAGGAVVRLDGVRQRPRIVVIGNRVARRYTLRTFDKSFYAKGRNLRVELRSPVESLSMTAFGRGSVVRLAGRGVYHLNGGPELTWQSAQTPIAIRPPVRPAPVAPAERVPAA